MVQHRDKSPTSPGRAHLCLTGCAATYNTYRRGSRNFNKVSSIFYILASLIQVLTKVWFNPISV